MEKSYNVLNIMYLDEEIGEENVVEMSLSDEYTKYITKNSGYVIDANPYIGEPRYYKLGLSSILQHVYSKMNVDMFCKNNPETYGNVFIVWNESVGDGKDFIIKYKPLNESI